MRNIRIIPVGDNYSYLVFSGGRGWVVDPASARAVIDQVEKESISLETIFLTHRHHDHTAGARVLAERYGAKVIGGGASGLPLRDGEIFPVAGEDVEVLATPGHTDSDYSYYLPPQGEDPGLVFTGDTLFLGGCGRIFQENPARLWTSLRRLGELPPDTLIYCGHEYTFENYSFICSLDPGNRSAAQYLREITENRDKITVPRRLGDELESNPFLGAGHERLASRLGLVPSDSLGVFIRLRRLKDDYRGPQ